MNTRVVSVVVPCRNAAATLPRLVASLTSQQLPPGLFLEIVIVDNNGTDSSIGIPTRLPVRYVREARQGPACARNSGVRAAGGETIIFMDADTRAVTPHFVATHVKTLDERPEVGVTGGPITHDPEQRNIFAFAENATALFNWHDQMPARYLTFQPMGNMAFRRALFDRVGPLDETLTCLEDFDWNMRVLKAGYKIYFNPEAGVWIRGRDSLPEILSKFYAWGLNVRSVYLPGRRSQVWLFPDHHLLFYFNIPWRLINETWVTIKRWFPVCPVKTILLVPLFLLYRAAWVAGMAVGPHR